MNQENNSPFQALMNNFQEYIDVGNEEEIKLYSDILHETIPEFKLTKISELCLMILHNFEKPKSFIEDELNYDNNDINDNNQIIGINNINDISDNNNQKTIIMYIKCNNRK